MASLNIVSIPKHFDKLAVFMEDKQLDIISLNETRLDETITDNQYKIDNYTIVRKDRSRTGGGVCTYFRNTIAFKNRFELIPSDLEAVCLEVMKPKSRPFVVLSVYRPPNSSSEFFDMIEKAGI